MVESDVLEQILGDNDIFDQRLPRDSFSVSIPWTYGEDYLFGRFSFSTRSPGEHY